MQFNLPPQPPHPTSETADNRAALAEMRDICMDMARLLREDARTPPPPDAKPQPDRLPKLSAALEGIARCLRRTIDMHERLGQPAPVRRNSDQLPRKVAKRRILREVEDALGVLADPADHESLREDLRDRLDRPELDDEIDNRPIGHIIMDIRRDLGLENRPGQEPWTRRTTAEWVDLCARADGRPPSGQPVQPAPDSPVRPAPNSPFHLDPSRFRGKPAPA
jgi:hypothetical protein